MMHVRVHGGTQLATHRAPSICFPHSCFVASANRAILCRADNVVSSTSTEEQVVEQEAAIPQVQPSASEPSPPVVVDDYSFDPALLRDAQTDPDAYYARIEASRRRDVIRGLAIDLRQSPEWVEERLQGVQLLLPDLPHPEEMQRDVILQMLVQYQQLPMRIVGLRQLLPKVNLSRMFINLPRLLVEPPLDWLEQHLQYVKAKLPNTDIDDLVNREPAILITDINVVIGSIMSMLGNDTDYEAVINDCPTVITMRPVGTVNRW